MKEDKYLLPLYKRLDVSFVKGKNLFYMMKKEKIM